MKWSSYARVYDLMASNNPAYQDLVSQFVSQLSAWSFAPNDLLVDLGAGTGNFSIELAAAFPHCTVLHIDSDPIMNQIARWKAEKRSIQNINIIQQDVSDYKFDPESVALFTCIHSLYTFNEPFSILNTMFYSLKPGGFAYICDIGRVLDIHDWATYLFKHIASERGFLYAVWLFIKGREVTKQNRQAVSLQKSGAFWTHTHAEFCDTLKSSSFDILKSYETYRGYSDIAICRKLAYTEIDRKKV